MTSEDKDIILMKEGTWFVPVYSIEEKTQKKIGLFEMGNDLIEQLMENV